MPRCLNNTGIYLTLISGAACNGSFERAKLRKYFPHSVHERPVGGGTAYILCDEVDDYCAKIKKNGAIVKSDPKNYPYGMRDFMAIDPDGNHLAFGCEAKNI